MARRRYISNPFIVTLCALLFVAAMVGAFKLISSPDGSTSENFKGSKKLDAATSGEVTPLHRPASTNDADNATTVEKTKQTSAGTKQTSVTTKAADNTGGERESGALGRVTPPTGGALAMTEGPAVPAPAKPTQSETPAASQPTAISPPSAGTSVMSAAATKQLIDEATAKQKADDLVAARLLLVRASDSRSITATDREKVITALEEVNAQIVFSPRKFLSDDHAVAHLVKPGEVLAKIAGQYDTTAGFICRINGIADPRKLQAGRSIKVIKGPFHARVDKTHFTLDIFLGRPDEAGAILVRRFKVGLGATDSTPTGVWQVDGKLVNPRYYNPRNEGPRVIEPDDPKNPLGERWIALSGISGAAVGKTSYGIHGTIDPDSIGQQKSMGCIRMKNEDVEVVYDMLVSNKSTVTIIE